jgi:hypothetical protein
MVRRSQADWRALIETQASSGMTAAAFCRKQGINQKYFSFRRRQLDLKAAAPTSRFIPVNFGDVSRTEMLRLRVGTSTTLELPPSVESEWLAGLLRGLKD